MQLLEGKKTYIGLAIIVLGWLGISHLVTETELAMVADSVIQLVGIGIAIYGRYKAKK